MPTQPRAFVMGHPIAHSRSPMLHNYWMEQLGIIGSYERLDIPPLSWIPSSPGTGMPVGSAAM